MTPARTPTRLKQVARAMLDNGWSVIPIPFQSKAPKLPGWPEFNKRQPVLDEVKAWVRSDARVGAGLPVSPEHVAVDLDITDTGALKPIVDEAVRIFGKPGMVRIGQAPKLVMLYRQDGSVKSTKAHPVEIFAGSGQIVAYGIHPGTKHPYTWRRAHPAVIAADDARMPVLDAERVNDFLTAVKPLLPVPEPRSPSAQGGVAVTSPGGVLSCKEISQALRCEAGLGGLDYAAAKALLDAEPGARHATLLSVAGLLKGSGWTLEEVDAFTARFWRADGREAERRRTVRDCFK